MPGDLRPQELSQIPPSVTSFGSACLVFKGRLSSIISRGFSIEKVQCKKELFPRDDGFLLDNKQHVNTPKAKEGLNTFGQ